MPARQSACDLPSQVEAADEPLKLAEVVVPLEVELQVERVWRAQRKASVYKSSADVIGLIKEVLSRDIRSLNQRLYIHPVGGHKAAAGAQQQQQQQQGAGHPTTSGGGAEAAAGGEADPRGRYIVVLDGMDVTYDLTDDGVVVLRGVYKLGGGVDGGEELAAAAEAEAARRQRRSAVASV